MKNIYYKSYVGLYLSNHFSSSVNLAICNLGKYQSNILSIYKIGSSVQGIPILAISLGSGSTTILVDATHHARECITSILLLDQISYMLELYKNKLYINKISITQLLKNITFVFVPLVNPDGADLVLNGEMSISNNYKNKPYLQNKFFSIWKSNINGVDLNRNYPTSSPSKELNFIPGPQGYPGDYYFSQPETLALKCLTEKYLFDGTISYHSSGEEIYWYYNQLNKDRDLLIANKISMETGYSLVPIEDSTTGSGYKDWFIETYKKPSLTIEVSPYVGPQKVPIENYYSIFHKNKNVPILFGQEIYNLCIKKD